MYNQTPHSMKAVFGTKAETLDRLFGRLKNAKILPVFSFTVKEWKNSQNNVISRISKEKWAKESVIVRSSCRAEDTEKESLAGQFLSVQNCRGIEQIQTAISKVISSYGTEFPDNHVLIQPMLKNVVMNGVAFSRDPNTGAPYFVINYNETHGCTDAVTSGSAMDLKVLYVHKNTISGLSAIMKKIVNLMKELEGIFQESAIDIEFALTEKKELFLLQARPLVIQQCQTISDEDHKRYLQGIYEKVELGMKEHPYLYGKQTVYGVMPDWNPAEIVGIRPRPFALSLYKEIITDNIWAYQRFNYGYRNVRSFPLLLNFHGLPYIDVRVSFNSFIPADLDSQLAQRLTDYYINRLISMPALHDKVEFDIIFSCYTLDLPQRIQVLNKYNFFSADIELFSSSLRKLTNKIINGETGLWKMDTDRIAELELRFEKVISSSLEPISKIYWLLEDCKRYGTLPFAGLARAGFIAVQLLKSLVSTGVLSKSEYGDYLSSLNTISSQMKYDSINLSKSAFLKKYGHLRPGTYDILSPRYDEAPDLYFDWEKDFSEGNDDLVESKKFTLSLPQLKHIERLLTEHGLEHNVLGLFDFLKAAIEGREYSKFVFTKSLSYALKMIQELALELGISLDDCSYLDISMLKDLYGSSYSIRDAFLRSIEEGKRKYELTKHIILPPLISSPNDIWCFEMPPTEPNYITLKKVSGAVRYDKSKKEDLKKSIMLIQSADPGYDWIFSHDIAGFVTMYGGANSHMAIRAGEMGIPAVVGAGEVLFNKLMKARMIEIDAGNRQVKILK